LKKHDIHAILAHAVLTQFAKSVTELDPALVYLNISVTHILAAVPNVYLAMIVIAERLALITNARTLAWVLAV
jgi:hypothetical protein